MDKIWGILNSSFVTAFFGAVFGSGTILVIAYFQKKKEILAEINASIAIFSGLINSYLMIKKQHALPVCEAYHKDLANFSKPNDGVSVVKFEAYLKKYNCPPLDFDLPMINILALAGKHAYVIPYLMRAKKSILEVEEACELWNESATELFKLDGQERVLKYLGIKKHDGVRDTTFPDTIENLSGTIEDALFFTDLGVLALQKVGKTALPWWCKSKVIKLKIEGDEYKSMMPSRNHKPGWGDDLN